MIRVFIGYDETEAAAYHVCVESIIRHANQPVQIVPLAKNMLKGICDDTQRDGSNAFIYSRFFVPYLCDFDGYAIWIDGDMLLQTDIAELWAERSGTHAVSVVRHEYKTKHPKKYRGADNPDYPRKNWSSVILWNCGHPSNRKLTPKYIAEHDGKHLHRLAWLDDNEINGLPRYWNWLVREFNDNPRAKLLHYTIGIPAFPEYQDDHHADEWHETLERVMRCDY